MILICIFRLFADIKSKRNCWDEVCVIECEEKEVCVIDCGEKCYNYNDTSRCVRNCEDRKYKGMC